MKNILKVFLASGLSFLLLSSALHIDSHNHNFTEGYSFCEINCDNEEHHFSIHQCEQCIVKQTQSIRKECDKLTYPNHEQFYTSWNNNFNKTVICHALYSRPPPQNT